MIKLGYPPLLLTPLAFIGAQIRSPTPENRPYHPKNVALSRGCFFQVFGSETHGALKKTQTNVVIVTCKVSASNRLYRSSTRASGLFGKPNISTHALSSSPTVVTTSVSPSHRPTECPYHAGPRLSRFSPEGSVLPS